MISPLVTCSPFIKWAGGKRQLLEELNKRLPSYWNTYYEPFVGGGALLASLENQGRLSRAVIADLNAELINLYRVVQDTPDALVAALSDEEFKNDEASYTFLKSKFNTLIGNPSHGIERAALLIYLNKHGFNGLWRVNSKGKFNVPFGSHRKRSIPSESCILKFSALLGKVTILNADFEKAVKTARKGDFIYFDPPYQPVSKTASFTDYNSRGFRFEDQERLAHLFRKLSKKGIHLMLSNSKVAAIEELYDGFCIDTVDAKRFINCNGERRSGIQEIIVTNYRDPVE
ncbi:MAG: DNA adenine methylase [Methanoregula sp.]|nr:DNA adenine methylase [Methanoregula sp.]